MDAALVAFGVVLVAELGDKSQLLALALATRHRPAPVLLGITLATAAVNAVSVVVGAAAASALPERGLAIAGGVIFVGFAVWVLRDEEGSTPEAVTAPRRSGAPAVASAALAFLVAEMGDKTMLATMALAAQGDALATWTGATLAMVAVNGPAVMVGHALGARLPERGLRLAGAAAFLLFGLVLLVEGVRG